MKVFNLTDISTPQLVQLGLVDVTLVVGRTAVAPGQSATVHDEPHILAQVMGYEKTGALSREIPKEYLAAKLANPPAAAPAPTPAAPVPVQSKKGKKGR